MPADSQIEIGYVRLPGKPPMNVEVSWRYVRSSNVLRVGWDEASNMYVTYQDEPGRIYIYVGVSRQRVAAAIHAPSTGIYINRRIKPNFKFLTVGGET